VQKEIADKLSEYIIEPKVTVQVVQVKSLKYMVLGDVNKPGVYDMNRRLSVMEAIAEAGDVTKYGNRTKISVLRMRQDGSQQPYAINLKGMQKGSGEPFYLSPGDVIFVPGNKMKTVDQVLQNVSMLGWFRMIFF
jgi:polysaccharide export outer membrane protein